MRAWLNSVVMKSIAFVLVLVLGTGGLFCTGVSAVVRYYNGDMGRVLVTRATQNYLSRLYDLAWQCAKMDAGEINADDVQHYVDAYYDSEETDLRFQITRESDGTVISSNGELTGIDIVQSAYYQAPEQTAGGHVYVIRYGLQQPVQHDHTLMNVLEFASWASEARAALMALGLMLLLASIFCFGFLMAALGHREGEREIHLNWLDRIPLDLLIAIVIVGLLLLTSLVGSLIYNMDGMLVLPWVLLALWLLSVAVALLACFCTFVVRIKARTFFKQTLLWMILRPIGRALGYIGYAIRNLSAVWQMALLLIGFVLADFIIAALFASDPGIRVLWWMMSRAALGTIALVLALNLKQIEQCGQAIAHGDMAPVDTRRLLGGFRRHGEQLNRIGEGLNQAVEERMRSERMKTELITNVSHDIKTPLTAIVSYVDLLKKTNITDPEALSYIEVLDRQSARLKRLTMDLVEASKAATGSLPVNCEPMALDVLIAQSAGENEERLAQAGIALVVGPVPEGIQVSCDGRHIARVMDNLMSNVAKYAMPGTRAYLDVRVEPDSVWLTLMNVSRDPLNIPPEELMERFVRGDSSRTGDGGSGLGLSIARSLTELQQGSFQLEIEGDLFKAILRLKRVI